MLIQSVWSTTDVGPTHHKIEGHSVPVLQNSYVDVELWLEPKTELLPIESQQKLLVSMLLNLQPIKHDYPVSS